jgi:DNA polymerase-1
MAKPPERLDVAGVVAKFGVPPDRIIDYLTLIGDTVDNVPGVDKVGPKTAAKWMAEHGSLDGVVAAAAGIKGVAGENLRKALDWLPTGPQADHGGDRLRPVGPRARLAGAGGAGAAAGGPKGCWTSTSATASRAWRKELETELGVGARMAAAAGRRCRGPAPTGPTTARWHARYETVLDWDRLDAWLQQLQAADWPRWTPRPTLDPLRRASSASALPPSPAARPTCRWRTTTPARPSSCRWTRCWRAEALAGRPGRAKVGQNIKYDLHVLANAGITVRGYAARHAAAELCAGSPQDAQPGSAGRAPPGPQGPELRRPVRQGCQPDPVLAGRHRARHRVLGEDSEMTLHVHQTLWPQLAEPACAFVYERIEMPVSTILQRIERHGVLIDAACWPAEPATGRAHGALEQQAYEIAGQPFNLGSPSRSARSCSTSWACR